MINKSRVFFKKLGLIGKGSVITFCVLVISFSLVKAQKNYVKQDTISVTQDSVVIDSTKVRMWVLGTSFGNNSSFLGRYQANRLPYYSADITYKSKSGFWLSAMAYQVINTNSFLDEVDLLAGWSFTLSKRIDGSIYYGRYFFPAESELVQAAIANSITGSVGLDWQYVYSKLSTTCTFGGNTDFFLVLDNSRYFEIEKLIHKKDYLGIEPKISIIAGTQTFVDSYITRQGAQDSSPSPVKPPFGGGGGPTSGGGQPATREQTTTAFNVLTYEFSVPITYTINDISFELSSRYSVPVNVLEGDNSTSQLFLTASLFYFIY